MFTLPRGPRAQAVAAGLASLAMVSGIGAAGLAARSALQSDAVAHVRPGHACSVNHPAACRSQVFPPHGRCFPVRQWNANPTRLPCAEIVRVYEDGSVRLRVEDGDGTVRYSLGVGVPDSYECAAHLIAARLCR